MTPIIICNSYLTIVIFEVLKYNFYHSYVTEVCGCLLYQSLCAASKTCYISLHTQV